MIEYDHPVLSIRRQCELLDINRSSVYYRPEPVDDTTLALMRRIDEIHTEFPYYGEPRITATLKREGNIVNHKKVERLMSVMGIRAILAKKNINTSKGHPGHSIYPYLLSNVKVNRPNLVWGTDITYIPIVKGWIYLTALMDWHSRYILSWGLSNNLSVDFCLEALESAIRKYPRPNIHNSDQGSQFTSQEYIDILKKNQINISMDHRGRCFDNIFTERLWRTIKYEEVYLREYQNMHEAKYYLNRYINQYNHDRLHQSLQYRTPYEVYNEM